MGLGAGLGGLDWVWGVLVLVLFLILVLDWALTLALVLGEEWGRLELGMGIFQW